MKLRRVRGEGDGALHEQLEQQRVPAGLLPYGFDERVRDGEAERFAKEQGRLGEREPDERNPLRGAEEGRHLARQKVLEAASAEDHDPEPATELLVGRPQVLEQVAPGVRGDQAVDLIEQQDDTRAVERSDGLDDRLHRHDGVEREAEERRELRQERGSIPGRPADQVHNLRSVRREPLL